MHQQTAERRAPGIAIPAAIVLFFLFASAAAAALEEPPGTAPGADRPGGIEGSVTDDAGRPLASATVFIEPAGATVLTDGQGRFAVTGLAAGTYRVEARAIGHAIDSLESVRVTEGEVVEVTFRLTPVPTPLDEIVVTARYSLLREQPIRVVDLSREEIMELPHFGDDLYRAIAVLPGTSGADFSARFNVRGGLHDELLVRLDGLEIFEPFHLKDFDGVFNILDPEVIGAVDLFSGGFPAEYGDRMTGVLDMTTSRPDSRRVSLGISFSNAWAGGSGTFADGKGRWLGSARRGYLDLVLGFVGEDQGREDEDDEWSPRYWDLFGKIDYDPAPGHSLSFKVLTADDSLTIDERDGAEITDAETSYGNTTVGLSHLAILGSKAVVETFASLAAVERERLVAWSEPGEFFDLRDDRRLDVANLRQEWNLDLADRHYAKTGFEARSSEAEYDYFNDILDRNYIDDPRFPPPSRSTRFVDDFSGEQYSLWAADRLRLGRRLTAELGARWDEQTLNHESQVSPRINLVLDLARKGLVRAGWGHFHQSERAHELDVQFAETSFHPAQRAEHFTLGYERQLGRGYRLRLDGYRRDVSDPLPRWETLFDPFNPIPEARPDVIRVAADRVVADGVELYLKGPAGGKLDWWLSYALSSIEDEIGGVRQHRYIDQTHAVTANANYRLGRRWNFSWVWVYHTGWPTTALEAELVRTPEGQWKQVHTIGPFYEERLPGYHRLDMRASRTTEVGSKGRLTLFVDVQNLYNRENLRGYEIDDYAYYRQPDGRLLAVFDEEAWFGIMPSFGVSWEM